MSLNQQHVNKLHPDESVVNTNLDEVFDMQQVSINMIKKATKKVDRRVLRTRKQLSQSLLELMQQSSFEEITIKDITDRADMNRATFYLHYGTKEELLFKSLESRFDELVHTIETQLETKPDEPIWADGCYEQMVFEHVADHVDLYKVVLDQNGMGTIIHQIIDYIAAVTLRHTIDYHDNQDTNGIPLEAISRHVAGSMFSLIVWWVRNDLPHPPTEMADICHRLINLGCDNVFGTD